MTQLIGLTNAERLCVALCICAMAVTMVAAFSPYGVLGMTYDSFDLTAASESIDTYLDGRNAEGHSYLLRAPFHPLLLSFFGNKMVAMWWVNLLAMTCALVLVFLHCRHVNFPIAISTFITLTVAMFYPWLTNFKFFWTEPVFICLILLLAYSMLLRWPFYTVVAICICLFTVRKAGIFFFFAAASVYLASGSKPRAAVISLVGLFTFIAWQVLEYTHASTGFFGIMLENRNNFMRIYYLQALTSWFVPSMIPMNIRVLLILSVFILAFSVYGKTIFAALTEMHNATILIIPAVYSAMVIGFSGTSDYETAERLLTVVFPLWIVGIASIGRSIFYAGTSARITIKSVVFVWVVYSFLRTTHHLLWPVV